MAEAARLAREGVQHGHGGPFGAVVVKGGAIVGRAHNCVVGDNDPTAHAEILALRAAGAALGTFDLSGCTLYTTCEPCPMCLAAAHWARLDKIVYAQTRKDAAAAGFDDVALYDVLEKPSMPLEQSPHAEAAEAFVDWYAKRDKTPY